MERMAGSISGGENKAVEVGDGVGVNKGGERRGKVCEGRTGGVLCGVKI